VDWAASGTPDSEYRSESLDRTARVPDSTAEATSAGVAGSWRRDARESAPLRAGVVMEAGREGTRSEAWAGIREVTGSGEDGEGEREDEESAGDSGLETLER